MGLDCSHDAFHGAYSAFNRLRQCVARALGPDCSYPPYWLYDKNGEIVRDNEGLAVYNPDMDGEFIYFPTGLKESKPGLYEFMTHSDCDGEIAPDMCTKVADDLESLLPAVEALGWVSHGHIAARGGFVEVLRKFIAGCRAAAAEGVPLDFH